MSEGAFTGDGLTALADALRGHVDAGTVPGAVALLSCRGETWREAFGAREIDGPPMTRDTIFRISSNTKPIVAVAAMTLVEDGTMALDEPVERWLPELAERRVLRRLDGPLDDTEPARRAITVRDLLTMRLGFGFILEPGDHPIVDAASDLSVMPGPSRPQDLPEPDEWLRRFATLPLMAHPGDRWMYDTAFTVLGMLISRVSGRPLPDLLRDRVLTPLGMTSTGFHVPTDDVDRFATSYACDESGDLAVYDPANHSQWATAPTLPDAAGGLVSTVDDLLAFGRAVLGDGPAILARESIGTMTTDQLAPDQAEAAGFFLDHRAWGFGFSIVTDGDAGAGRVGWDGGLGTTAYVDPRTGLIGVLLTQVMPPEAEVMSDFWRLAFAAMDT